MKPYGSIQNSMKGIIILYQNFNKGNLTLQFCIATNPKKPNEIKKGDRIYDYQNGRWFALMEEEANQILMWMQNPQLQEQPIEIKHYPENGMTVLSLSRGDQGFFILSYAEIQNKQRTFHLALALNETQLMMFANYLKTFPLVKTLAAYHDFVSWKNNSNTNSNGYQQQSNRYQQNNAVSFSNNQQFQQQPANNQQFPQQSTNPILSFIK